MPANPIFDRIRKELIENGQDTRYKLSAYEFVLNGLEFHLSRIGEKRHVNGAELSRGLLLFAHKQFGPLALNVLNHFGIYKTDDVGNIVYNLIGLGIMSKQPADSLDHFINVENLEKYFKQIDIFEIDKEFIKKLK